jgi:hypothetical protein
MNNPKIFISHSTLDKSIAERVILYLRSVGYRDEDLFLDSDQKSGIEIGSDWEERLYDAIQVCACMIVLCSKNWEQSKWCFAEALIAKHRKTKVLPLLLSSDVNLSILDSIQSIRNFSASNDDLAKINATLVQYNLGPDSTRWNVDLDKGAKDSILREVEQAINNKFEHSNVVNISNGNNITVSQSIGLSTKSFVFVVGLIVVLVLGIIFVPGMLKDRADKNDISNIAARAPDLSLASLVGDKSGEQIDKETQSLKGSNKRIAIRTRLKSDAFLKAERGEEIEFEECGFQIRAYFLSKDYWPGDIPNREAEVEIVGDIDSISTMHSPELQFRLLTIEKSVIKP